MRVWPAGALRLVALLIATLIAGQIVTTSTASVAAAAEDRIRASDQSAPVVGGPLQYVSAGQHPGPAEISGRIVVATGVAAKTVPGYGVRATPKRVPGPWTVNDLKQGAFGRPPRSLGRPDLHHADQMPGSGIHEVPPGMHRGNANLHPNKYNQGVTDQMRMQDRQLHWWYRSQEMGGWDTLGPSYYYDNWP